MQSAPTSRKLASKLLAVTLVFFTNHIHAQVAISDSCDLAASQAKLAGWSDSRISDKMKFEASNTKAAELSKLKDGYGVMSKEKFRDALSYSAIDTGFYLCAAKNELAARANSSSTSSNTTSGSASQPPQPSAVNNQSTQTSTVQTLLSTLQTLQSIKNGGGTGGGSGLDTSASCRGKGSCQFQMPTIAGCGTYAPVSYPGGYEMEQTNTCSYDVVYRLVIKKGPNFDGYGGYDASPKLRPGQKFKGNGMFYKSDTTKALENYSCRTHEDMSKMPGMKVAGGPDPNRKGCVYITPPDEVGTSQ